MRASNTIGQPIRPLPRYFKPRYDRSLTRGILLALCGLVVGFGAMWIVRGK